MTTRLYILGGQSNMSGFGQVAELDASMRPALDNASIFQGNAARDASASGGLGRWSSLEPGHGEGFSSDGECNHLASLFGPELSFGHRMRALAPDTPIAILKYARGGSSLDPAAGRFGSWQRGREHAGQFEHFAVALHTALASWPSYASSFGGELELVPAGFAWMQGESDAEYSVAIAERYEAHLRALIEGVRALVDKPTLPVVIGRISDSRLGASGANWPHAAIVRGAQERLATADRSARLITATDSYTYADRFHYGTEGMLDLGARFADALHALDHSAQGAGADSGRRLGEIEVE